MRLRVFQRGNTTFRAGHTRNPKLFHRVFGGDLVAHDADVFRCRADEGDPVVFDDLHEPCVLGQKAIAGVDCLCAGDFTG